MQNAKTIESIRQLFALLEQHGAILGRTQTHIVIDRQAMPGVVDWMTFAAYRLEFDDGVSGASRGVFSGTSMSAELVIVDISDIDKDRYSHEHFKRELSELSELFAQIPQLGEDQLKAVEACKAGASALLAEHGPEALRALLRGEIAPMVEETKH